LKLQGVFLVPRKRKSANASCFFSIATLKVARLVTSYIKYGLEAAIQSKRTSACLVLTLVKLPYAIYDFGPY